MSETSNDKLIEAVDTLLPALLQGMDAVAFRPRFFQLLRDGRHLLDKVLEQRRIQMPPDKGNRNGLSILFPSATM